MSDEKMETKNPTLEDAKYVMARAKYVHIDEEAIERVAREWAKRDFQLPKWDFFVDEKRLSLEERFDHFLVGDCLNFKYWNGKGENYKTIWNGQEYTGAAGMFASLQRAEENGIPILDGEYLSNLTEEDLKVIFNNYCDGELADGEVPMPMLKERVEILRAVGKKLVEEYDGRFHKILEKTGKKVKIVEFVEFLAAEFPEAFRDVSDYADEEIKFHKKANLAAAQAWENLIGTGYFEILDPENSVVFADYVLPMVERHNGMLKYSSELAEAVDSGRSIEPGSEWENEIRAGAVYSSDRLKEAINSYREPDGLPPITGFHIDAAEWFEGVTLRKGGVELKHHRTLTTNY